MDLPDHDLSAVHGYRRTLDLAQALLTTTYVRAGVTYRRQIFASRPDDVIVLHFTQSGGGRYTGSVTLEGTHGETGGERSPSGRPSPVVCATARPSRRTEPAAGSG